MEDAASSLPVSSPAGGASARLQVESEGGKVPSVSDKDASLAPLLLGLV